MIWLPTVYTGLSEVMGSWKIMLISLPRMERMRRGAGFNGRAKEHIYGGPLVVDFGSFAEAHLVGVAAPAQHDVKAAGCDQREAGRDDVAVLGLTDLKRAEFIEALGEREREMGRDVLDDANTGQVAGQPGQDRSQGLRAAGGGAN